MPVQTVAAPPASQSDFPARAQCVIPALVAERAASHPDRQYLAFADGSTWTYQDTMLEGWRGAHALQSLGVGFGEIVSVFAPAGADLMRTWFGAAELGAVYAPLNLAARGKFLEHTLNLAGARTLIVHAGLADRLAGLELERLETIVLIGDYDGPDLRWPTAQLTDLLGQTPEGPPTRERDVEAWDPAVLIYTSGTTGPSKAVISAYASLWLFDRNFVWPEVGADDCFLQALPMFHMSGVGATYSMLRRGGSVALLPSFQAKSFWSDVRRFGATVTCVLHAMVSYLLKQPPRNDDLQNPLRLVYMGPLSHVEEFSSRFGVGVYTAFGMTEVPVPIRSELNPRDVRSCGRAIDPEVYEVRIVDEHDIPLGPGQPGELVVRHSLPWVMNSGYHGMPEATARAWANGWFHTGDQFIIDEGGSFYFVDRVKDSIRRRGENISSFEVEAEVLSHPAVEEVAAVAIPNPDVVVSTGDEEVKVVVVLASGQELTHSQLIGYLVERMPRHWVPRFVEFAAELPKTPSFKVKKAELRAAGMTPATWDRERAGIVLKREQLD
jgi:crotonobetaine/carnitine-CoA ligase